MISPLCNRARGEVDFCRQTRLCLEDWSNAVHNQLSVSSSGSNAMFQWNASLCCAVCSQMFAATKVWQQCNASAETDLATDCQVKGNGLAGLLDGRGLRQVTGQQESAIVPLTTPTNTEDCICSKETMRM